MNEKNVEVIIVGAGLAGLSCACRLLAENRDVILLEASERIGGRVKTDVVEGFLAFRYFFSMFAKSDVGIPALGMEAIPKQIGSSIESEQFRFGSKVQAVREGGVTLETGEELSCRKVVLAVEAPEVERLLGFTARTGSRGEHCLYFSTEEPPFREPLLVVNAEGRGPINNLCVPSQVAPTYAPIGRSLISVTVIGQQMKSKEELEHAVRDQLGEWYGRSVRFWDLLRIYSIDHALPDQPTPAPDPTAAVGELRSGIFVCGEYGSLPSIQWALLSGRLAAEAVSAALAL
jgi:phytoene dehydrogenase-like protein